MAQPDHCLHRHDDIEYAVAASAGDVDRFPQILSDDKIGHDAAIVDVDDVVDRRARSRSARNERFVCTGDSTGCADLCSLPTVAGARQIALALSNEVLHRKFGHVGICAAGSPTLQVLKYTNRPLIGVAVSASSTLAPRELSRVRTGRVETPAA
jgi:hypothetical protein